MRVKYNQFKKIGMKKLLIIPALLSALALLAQTNVDVAKNQAFELARKGDYTKAIEVLIKAEQSAPDNIVLTKDIAYYNYLKGDYDKAVEYGNKLIKRDDADEQAYQILGSAYRLAKKYDESENIYGEGIGKFPQSAVLYAELGGVYADNNKLGEAISVWEKGVRIDPNISSNYYFLAKAFAKNLNPLRAILNAETFVNMENKTNRTVEMRTLLLEQYKTLFSNATYINRYSNGKNTFEKAVAESYKKFASVVSGNVNAESLSALRGQFIVDWYQGGKEKDFPFALFDRNRQMLRSGIFDAYNRWLFSSQTPQQFKTWGKTNEGQMSEFMRYFNASILKFPEGGQIYF